MVCWGGLIFVLDYLLYVFNISNDWGKDVLMKLIVEAIQILVFIYNIPSSTVQYNIVSFGYYYYVPNLNSKIIYTPSLIWPFLLTFFFITSLLNIYKLMWVNSHFLFHSIICPKYIVQKCYDIFHELSTMYYF